MKKKERQELKSLTRKYFIGAKLNEIYYLIIILGAILLVPLFVGGLIGDGLDGMCSGELIEYEYEIIGRSCTFLDTWIEGLVYSFISVVILLFLWTWLDSNWEKAKRKARRELKK